MNRKHIFTLILLTALAAFTLTGCVATVEPLHLVWTESETYLEFYLRTGTEIPDGRYIKMEIPESSWAVNAATLDSEYRHLWTKRQIKDWFTGRGFGTSEAVTESSWLTTTNHAMIVSRKGMIVNLIVK